MRVTILTNGPGELWGWVRPVVMELRKRGHSVSLWLLPCQFASGYEREAASLLGVDKLEGPSGTSKTWHDILEEKTDRVIQLGGDIMFGLRMARNINSPLTFYTYAPRRKLDNTNILTAFPSEAQRSVNAIAIGDLVKDSLDIDAAPSALNSWNWPPSNNAPRILFLPGSRPAIRFHALKWLREVYIVLREAVPSIRVRTLFSQFMPSSEFELWQKEGLNPVRAGAGVAMRGADYALTQPGTNTFEMMHCGLPGLVAAPEDFLKVIPVSGILGLLGNMPLIGMKLKRIALTRTIQRWGGFISLPNRIAGRSIIHEIYGSITPEDIAQEIINDLKNPEALKRTHDELLSMSGSSGAASKLCDIALR